MNTSCLKSIEPNATRRNFEVPLYLLCIVNVVTAILAVIGNSLVLLVVRRTSALHSPSNVLLSGLALSDLAVGVVVQPVWVTCKMALIQQTCWLYFKLEIIWMVSADIVAAITFVTVSAVSFDRFLALKLHLRYRELVTIHRVLIFLVSLWLLATLYAIWQFYQKSLAEMFMMVTGMLILLFTTWCFFKIYQVMRHHHIQINGQATNNQNILSLTRYKRSLKTMLYILGIFLLSYLPYLLYRIFRKTHSKPFTYTATVLITEGFLETFVFINSCINPFTFCWRMKDLRDSVKQYILSCLSV